ncbi:alpha-galactosidase [Opitutaceae bacterium TAV5]|nr:alpha-galactosidase [Opitutaceae bacterium TAV5]
MEPGFLAPARATAPAFIKDIPMTTTARQFRLPARLPRFSGLLLTGFLLIARMFPLPLAADIAAAGPLPADIAAWDETEKARQREAGQALREQIAAAASSGQKELRIPTGHYRFAEAVRAGWGGPSHLPLTGLRDITLDFLGSTLWFETEAGGIAMFGGRNVTLKNVFLDWDPLPFTQGRITALNPKAGTFDVRLDPGYERERTSPGMAGIDGDIHWRGVVFDPDTRELKPGVIGFSVGFYWENRLPGGDYRVKFRGFHDVPLSKSGLAEGDLIAILSRMGRAVRLDGAVDCVIENVILYASPFVCFSQNTGSNTVFRRCGIVRRPDTNRLLAGNADGINCGNMDQGPLIEDCRIETIGDDFVNLHGHFARVLWQENPTTLLTSQMNNRRNFTGPVTVEFFDRATMAPRGSRRILEASVSSWTPERERCLADLDHKWHSGQAAGLAYGKRVPVHRLTLDSPIELTGDVIACVEAFSTAGGVIRNNDFRGSLARGILLHSPRTRIENNRISIVMNNGIAMISEAAYWGEGPYVHDVVVTGNTLEDICIGQDRGADRAAVLIRQGSYREHRIQKNIRVENNTLRRAGGPAIVARGAENLAITGNVIDGYRLARPTVETAARPAGADHAIALESVRGLVLRDNRIGNPGPLAKGELLKIDTEE